MTVTVTNICSELRKKYKVDEFYYPNVSMDVEIPNGLDGEVNEIFKVLTNYGYEISVANVFRVMELKKDFLIKYGSSEKGKKLLTRYQELLVTKIKPVGSTIPTDFIFINGLVLILLSIIARFGLSFADEAGKITARKLLDDDRRQSKKYNMNIDEFRFVKNEAMVWIKEGTAVKSFAKKMKIKKRPKRIKKQHLLRKKKKA